MKNTPLTPVVKNGVEYHGGWVFTEKDLAIVQGNLMAIIEGVGLPKKQEDAIKSQVRQSLYRPTRHTIFLSSEEVSKHGRFEIENPDDKNPIAFQHVEGQIG